MYDFGLGSLAGILINLVPIGVLYVLRQIYGAMAWEHYNQVETHNAKYEAFKERKIDWDSETCSGQLLDYDNPEPVWDKRDGYKGYYELDFSSLSFWGMINYGSIVGMTYFGICILCYLIRFFKA